MQAPPGSWECSRCGEQIKNLEAKKERAVREAATLRQALEQIAALSAYVGPASDGSTMRGPWIARAALDSAATGDAA